MRSHCIESTSHSPLPNYLFPQLTMGLALLIVILKTIALRKNDERYNVAVRFWGRIFALNFLLGVVTGIPMEFQFGTNWSEFSRWTGGVIGQPSRWKAFSRFSLDLLFWDCFSLAKNVSRRRPIGLPPFSFSGLMDLGLLHHRDRCMDAASGCVSPASNQLEQDTNRLKEAIANGSCTISEWKPYSAIEKNRTHRSGV